MPSYTGLDGLRDLQLINQSLPKQKSSWSKRLMDKALQIGKVSTVGSFHLLIGIVVSTVLLA
jgi:hypothetical protein